MLAKKLAPDEVTSSAMPIDVPIKTLEKSLLDFDDRLSNQESAMEALTQKLDKSSSSSPSGEHAKSIKSLESKAKTIFDAVNIQQNSIDNLLDKLTENAKERKRIKEQVNTIQNNLTHQGRQHSGMLSEVKSEIGQLNQSDEKCIETISKIKSEVNTIKQHNKECDRTLSNMSTEVKKLSQTISQLTEVVSGMKQEISQLKAHDRQSDKVQDANSIQLPIWNQILAELSETRRETKSFFKDLHQQISQLDKTTQQGQADLDGRSNFIAATSGKSEEIKLGKAELGKGPDNGIQTVNPVSSKRAAAPPKPEPPKKQLTPNSNSNGKDQRPKMGAAHSRQTAPTAAENQAATIHPLWEPKITMIRAIRTEEKTLNLLLIGKSQHGGYTVKCNIIIITH